MSRSMNPASPLPVTASSVSHHKLAHGLHSPHGHHLHRQSHSGRAVPAQLFTKPVSRHAPITTPVGHAHGIPFRPNIFHPDDLSPRSTASSPTIKDGDYSDDVEMDDDVDDDDDEDDDEDDEDDEDEDDDDEDDDDEDDDDEDDDNDDDDDAIDPDSSCGSASPPQSSFLPRQLAGETKILDGEDALDEPAAAAGRKSSFVFVEETLVIEEITDYDSADAGLQVLRPDTIEEPESERSPSPAPAPAEQQLPIRPHSHHHRPSISLSSPPRGWSFSVPGAPDIDCSVMSRLQDLTCGTEESAVDDNYDDSDFDETEVNIFLLKQRAERRRRRMTSGSISKRTISESIGSDTDTEDLNHLQTLLDISEVGSSARRLRRRIDRHSLQFSVSDPAPPRIDELDEPDTTDGEDGDDLARELPYYTLEYISMEVDSP